MLNTISLDNNLPEARSSGNFISLCNNNFLLFGILIYYSHI